MVLRSGEKPDLEKIMAKQVICSVQLWSGVVSHAAARRLNQSGWALDESGLRYEADIEREISDGLGARLEEFMIELSQVPEVRGPEDRADEPASGALVVFADQRSAQVNSSGQVPVAAQMTAA